MEFPKIDTLYERGPDFKVIPGQFKNRTYSLLKTWRWTEKIDGTNTRIIYTPSFGNFVPCPANVSIGGRTDAANMPADLVQNLLRQVTPDKMSAIFQSPVTLYGEGYGGSIQKGSGYSPTKKFILFDVLVDNQWWLDYENVQDIGTKIGLDVVPFIGDMSLEDATEFVRAGFCTRIPGAAPDKPAEGLVGRPMDTLYDKRHNRLITKAQDQGFLMETYTSRTCGEWREHDRCGGTGCLCPCHVVAYMCKRGHVTRTTNHGDYICCQHIEQEESHRNYGHGCGRMAFDISSPIGIVKRNLNEI